MNDNAGQARTDRRLQDRSATKIAGASGAVLALGAALVTATPGVAGAATYTVTTNADSGAGSLREAIATANGTVGVPDVITFSPALIGSTITLTSGDLEITDELAIQGPGAASLTISGNDNDRVFYVSGAAGAVTVSGVTLTDGSAPTGGGILSFSDLTITDATITGNFATRGGGVAVEGASLTMTGSTVSENLVRYGSADGGGIVLFNADDSTITSSTISDNDTADDGGGVLHDESPGDLTITSSMITGNTAGGSGGGVRSYYVDDTETPNAGDVTIVDSTFADNYSSGNGGGVSLEYAHHLDVSGSTFLRNEARVGGAIDVADAYDVTITASTISQNTSASDGGGMSMRNAGALSITGSTFDANESGDDGGAIDPDIVESVTITGTTISDNTAADDAGGIDGDDTGDIVIRSSTISGNDAGGYGGAALFYNDGFYDVRIEHSTITGNTAEGEIAEYATGGIYTNQDIVVDHSIIAGNTNGDLRSFEGADNVATFSHSILGDSDIGGIALVDVVNNDFDVDPGLAALADNGGPTQTHALLDSSPALDGGDPAFAAPPATDQRGLPRIVGTIDKGAFERQPDAPTPTTPATDDDVDSTTGTASPAASPTVASPRFTG